MHHWLEYLPVPSAARGMMRERHGGRKLEMLSLVWATVNLRFLQDCDWKGCAQGGSSGSRGPQGVHTRPQAPRQACAAAS